MTADHSRGGCNKQSSTAINKHRSTGLLFTEMIRLSKGQVANAVSKREKLAVDPAGCGGGSVHVS